MSGPRAQSQSAACDQASAADPDTVTQPRPVPFALPDISEAEITEVVAALRSGWVSTGPRTAQFEADFATALGGGVHAVAVNSATAGLHLALEALGIGPGDEVIVPTWTFTATAEVVRYLGADPVLVDVLPDTLGIDLDAAARSITGRTRAIIAVHFGGYPLDLVELVRWGAEHDLAVVEDAAHAFPARYQGAAVGSARTAASVFSFYATKTITTGEGGMLVTHDPKVAARARTMRLHGMDRDAFGRYRSDVPSWRYDIVAPGFKYNMSDVAAALGLVQLRRAEEMRAAREAVARRYVEALADLPLELPLMARPGDLHAWHLFVVRTKGHAPRRDEVIARLAAQGIGTSVHFIPLHLMSYWRDRYGLESVNFPVASREFDRVLSLPLYSSMTATEVNRVIDGVRNVFT